MIPRQLTAGLALALACVYLYIHMHIIPSCIFHVYVFFFDTYDRVSKDRIEG